MRGLYRPLPASTGTSTSRRDAWMKINEAHAHRDGFSRITEDFAAFIPCDVDAFFSADTHECFYAVFEGYFFEHFHTFVSYRELHHHPRRGRGLIKEKEKRLMTRVGGCFCGNSCERGRSVSPLFLAFASKGQLDQKSNCVKANKRCTAQRSDTIVRG